VQAYSLVGYCPSYGAIATHLDHHAVHTPVSGDTSTTQSSSMPSPFDAIFSAPDTRILVDSLPVDGWTNSPYRGPQHTGIPSANILSSPSVVPHHDCTPLSATEPYGVPVGIVSPMNQSATLSFDSNPPTAPVIIEQKRWYSQYRIDRDASGSFHCPYAGCSKKTKRRDQLWEHWKAKHNDDPYRCNLWLVP
jgi:Zinc-binding